ncbi:heterokaryon incompatibility protein-domain-containing protein [Xylariaceae sp. FL1019]|nr:heterokaryon incompatibility protein-domain-containing protein [Xylariaceae sp. FL1019]
MNSLHGLSRRAKEGLLSRKHDSNEAFVHSRLKTSSDGSWIRLVSLEEGSKGDILKCTLRDADLDADPRPQYEAVSYSWRKDVLDNHESLSDWFPDKYSMYDKQEADRGTRLIFCNDKMMHIHLNLYDFLVRLRAKNRGLPLWIDAICIDQDESDPAIRREKLGQLSMMGEIYASAETVLVWLGESGNLSYSFDRKLDYIQQMPVEYEPYDTEYDIWKVHKKKPPLRLLGHLQGPGIMSLAHLVNRDYFQRSWVVQEIALARKLMFYLGGMELSTERLLGAIYTMAACDLNQHTEVVSPAEVSGSGFRAIPHMLQAQAHSSRHAVWSFRDYLFLCRDRAAFRPEDKVFAILGLVDAEKRQQLTKDAVASDGKTILDKLYANCASILATEHGWPYVLSLVAFGAAEIPDLPSWVPDLRRRLQPKPFWYYGSSHFCAATTLEGIFTIGKEDSSRRPDTNGDTSASDMPSLGPALTLRVAYVDEIVQVGESQAELLPTQIKYAKGHIIDLVTKLGTHYAETSELSMDAIMRTFTGDVFERDRKIPLPKLRRAFLAWFSLLVSNLSFEPSKARPQDSFFRNTAKGRLAVELHKTSVINCCEIEDIEAAVCDFVDVHDTPEFPFHRQLTAAGAVSKPLNTGKPELIISGEELLGVDVVEAMEERLNIMTGEDQVDRKDRRKRLVTEWEANDPRVFWQYEEQQVGSVNWVANQMFRHRRIFRTKNRNLVGMGHQDLKPGDIVCLVAGAETPFIFRRLHIAATDKTVAEPLQDFRLVGSAYVHGIMYGELLKHIERDFATVNVR